MEITIKTIDSKGFAVANEDDVKAGVMTFSIASPQLMIIDHTEIEPDFKGKDVGKQLLLAIVKMAREEHIKIIPLCPFANAMFQKNKELQDVLK